MAPRVALNTAAIASNVTTNGIIIDTQGFNALTFLLNVGARTDGTFAGSIQHGDTADLSDAATPAADDLIAPTGGNSINAAQTIKKFGYVGNKRYVRLNVTSTGVTSGATVGATALLGRPTVGPVA
ncbi:hypothetical protein [Rhizobium sp. P007]|uniref:hypothetical protein n=1 Tax=Rhizobium sp. P007 TaxID=285908 RepID=UPI00191B9EC6|nr:hypothetical protein [Rhizobium sp. P007]